MRLIEAEKNVSWKSGDLAKPLLRYFCWKQSSRAANLITVGYIVLFILPWLLLKSLSEQEAAADILITNLIDKVEEQSEGSEQTEESDHRHVGEQSNSEAQHIYK